MAQYLDPQDRKRRKRASLSAYAGGGGGVGFSLGGLFRGMTELFSGGAGAGWNLRSTLTMITLGLLFAALVFLIQGGGLLISAKEARFAGSGRDFLTCRYITLDGGMSRRLWRDEGIKGCPVFVLQ